MGLREESSGGERKFLGLAASPRKCSGGGFGEVVEFSTHTTLFTFIRMCVSRGGYCHALVNDIWHVAHLGISHFAVSAAGEFPDSPRNRSCDIPRVIHPSSGRFPGGCQRLNNKQVYLSLLSSRRTWVDRYGSIWVVVCSLLI